MEENEKFSLPENAQRELKPGEVYEPILSPKKKYKEVTVWSVVVGLLMTVLFSAAAAYLGLKVGQVFEAAIPIAIIAIGLSNVAKKNDALSQNVIIQSIGGCSGGVVAGAIFTLPALYILQGKGYEIEINYMQVFLSSLLGGVLGILFLIPFRKYFVKEQHGKFPFPEATATTQVLVSGQKMGKDSLLLVISGLIGGIYDFIISTFGWWSETISTKVIPWGAALADKAKLMFKVNVGAAVLGLGYIIGLKYAFIICCGSMLVWFIIIPGMNLIWGNDIIDLMNTGLSMRIGDMAPEMIFKDYARHIGIGGIAMAGVVSIIKSWGVIKSSVGLAANEFKGNKTTGVEVERTQHDLSMKFIVIGIVAILLLTFVFFRFGVVGNFGHAAIGILVVAVIAFLFTTVAANAIAIVGSNPVSGMTLMTLILASLVMVAAGLSGAAGMTAALIIGGVVCTALAVAGAFITDLKVGYWIGTTPKNQEIWKFVGVAVASATVAGVIMILNKAYGFVGEGALVAPQANAMSAVIEPMMSGGNAPWLLYGIGAAIALILTFLKIPALPFALGMFIPIDLNIPLLIGGAVSWFVSTRSKDEKLNKARYDRGTLIASGFIAGGALMGVVSAILKFGNVDLVARTADGSLFASTPWASLIALVMYVAIIIYMIWDSKRAKVEE
ncbi:MAG: oligopeptide transporter, OPT family [Bacteroidales bacterium]|jgi:putative OPT family oligopeptide transporter|nr:oligopeptide transporter, OPT family [Bacteroidales bacterium]